MTIQGTRHVYWRETYEKERPDEEQTVFPSRRTRTPESRQGRSQDRPDAWHADLRVGKRQGRGEEAVNHFTARDLAFGGAGYFFGAGSWPPRRWYASLASLAATWRWNCGSPI